MIGFGKSDIGKVRKSNEDSIYISNDAIGALPNIYIVADGMGGHNAGEIASKYSIMYFCEYIENLDFSKEDLLDTIIEAVNFANKKVYEYSLSDSEYEGMGTTFSCCTIFENKIYIAHVGDSRVYKFSKDELLQLTQDHTYVNEMVKIGQITKEQAKEHPNKNIITRALGITESLIVDGGVFEIKDDDKLIICSDGLTNMISDIEIISVLKKDISIEEKADIFINNANDNGGEDNISIIVIENER